MVELRLPNINGSDRDQLAQIRSYLYQIVPQLQWALNSVTTMGEPSIAVEQVVKRVSAPSTPETPSESAEAIFEKLKPLIIKSAEIVDAYYDVINKELSSQYVGESVFGTFVETTNQSITANANYVDQKFTDVQVITNRINGEIENINSSIDGANANIEDLKEYVATSKGYIRSGEIERVNGIPVYGIEIGQENGNEFKKFARFTSNRLAFFDNNNTEVAYISDFKLHITNADFIGVVTFGAFRLDTSKGFRLKYVGRGK